MKNFYLRSMAAFLCAACLSACGGSGNGTLLLSGSISGLSKTGLVLINNSNNTTDSILSGATAFSFATLINTDSAYDVEIQTQPDKANCTISGNKGTSSTINVTTVVLTCLTNQYHVGGHVTGLSGSQTLKMVNGKDTVPVQGVDGSSVPFTFAATVGDGAPYTITVLPSSVPSGRQCTVANGSGYLGSGDMLNAAVTCTATTQ